MRQRILGLSLLGALLLSLPSPAAYEKKKKPEAADPKEAIDADKLRPGEFVAKLLSIPTTGSTFKLTAQDLIQLKKAGASDALMLHLQGGSPMPIVNTTGTALLPLR